MSVYDAFPFELFRINIFKVGAFGRGEGVKKKSTLCTLVKMMTIMDDPLLDMFLSWFLSACTSPNL